MSEEREKLILVVDDDEIYRERLAKAFRSYGYSSVTACDVESAVLVMEEQRVDAAVLDLRMPGGGLMCLTELLARQPWVKAVILTGYGSIATAIQAVRVGAVDYLTKPADAEQILAILFGKEVVEEVAESYRLPSLDRLEWEHIQRVLQEQGGNISRAAEVLGLHRRSLQRKLQKFPPQE
jgi:two-component system response regulator RegA